MEPQRFKGYERVLAAPSNWDDSGYGPCKGLPVQFDSGIIYSSWKPSFRERLRVLFGTPIRLSVFSHAMPPVAIEVRTVNE